MFKQVLSKPTRKLLALLGKDKLFKEPYLAGGTALALQMGHRLSFDLDFYTKTKFKEPLVLKKLKSIGSFTESNLEWQTILGDFPQVKFSIFYYEYPLIKPCLKYSNINIASLEDISAMKIGAISSRGTQRDFIDLYYLCTEKFSLQEILGFYNQKYGNLSNLYPHIIKSLNYFIDADNDNRQLTMLVPYNWDKIKKYFLTEVPKLLNKEVHR